jgi:hypothetical protein
MGGRTMAVGKDVGDPAALEEITGKVEAGL